MTQPSSIVHIGYHKTATTWFQARFYPLVRNLRYVPDHRVRDAFLDASALRFDPAAARAALGAEHEPIVGSHEELSGSYQSAGLYGCLSKDVVERIHRTLPDARIVIFIRHQVDMIAAAYVQYIRSGGTHGPARFVFPHGRPDAAATAKPVKPRPYKRPLFHPDHFDYRLLIERYAATFGRERVHVFPYEAFRDDPDGFLRHFAAVLGLDVDIDAVSRTRSNVRFGRSVLRLGRVLNLFSAGRAVDKTCVANLLPPGAVKAGLNALNRTPLAGPPLGSEHLLGTELVREIHARYSDSNRRLAAAMELPLAAYGYPGTATATDGAAASPARVCTR